MSNITWRKSATKDVRPFFGVATLERSVELAEIRLYEDGPFMSDTAHAVEPSDSQPLDIAVRPNLALPAQTPMAKGDLVLAVTAVQPFMKKTIVVETFKVSGKIPDEILVGSDIVDKLGGGSNMLIEVALCLGKKLAKKPGSPFLLGHWLSKKSFAIKAPKLAEDFPIQPMTDDEWKQIGYPAKTLYSVDYIGAFNEPSEKDRQIAKVRIHADVHKKLTLESAQRLAKPMMASLAAEITGHIIAASLSEWETAMEATPNSPLSAFLKRLARIDPAFTFDKLKEYAKEPGMTRIKALLHADQQSVRSIAEG
jgi:hypothetical protein